MYLAHHELESVKIIIIIIIIILTCALQSYYARAHPSFNV